MGTSAGKTTFEVRAFRVLYRPLIRRSARHILQGRLIDPADPQKGRWLRKDVDDMLVAIWARVDALVEKADLGAIPTLGNRNNVYLAVLTTAAYQVLLRQGQTEARAAGLVADVGWKIYELGIRLASLPFRATTRDPAKRMQRSLDALMVFPFSAPGRPGYEVTVQKLDDKVLTHWTWCPPQAFVRSLTETDGDHGELEAFYKSWCLYDWPGADVIAGDGQHGHYTRKLTLSRGDAVCDMCWRHRA